MCELAEERIRINQILFREAFDWAVQGAGGECELVERCVAALEAEYGGRCVEECVRRRAEEFVAARFGGRIAA